MTTVSVVRSELERIYARDGLLDPVVIVGEAEDEASPLHAYFMWDDTEAARRFRLMQARGLIRSVRIRVETAPEVTRRVRAYVSVPRDDGRSYESLVDALSDRNTRDVVFEQCVRELSAVRDKYAALVDVEKAWAAAGKRRRRKAA